MSDGFKGDPPCEPPDVPNMAMVSCTSNIPQNHMGTLLSIFRVIVYVKMYICMYVFVYIIDTSV